MGHHFLVVLGLLCGISSTIQAQIAQPDAIVGPDGRARPALAPRPPQPSLEDQLRRRKVQEKERPPMPVEPATGTDELLGPQEKAQIAATQKEMDANEVFHPRFRMSLGLAIPNAKTVAGDIDTWRFDPGAVSETSFRLTDPSRPFTFWSGVRLAAWNGNATSATTFARFSVLYLGPYFAFEWPGTLRQSLGFGMAGMSRQTDPVFPGLNAETKTKEFGLDGTGLWLTYALGFRIVPGFDWEAKVGVQSSKSYLLSYLSLGVSLWVE